MNKYEILFIIDNAAADEVKEAVIAKMSELITSNGGSVEKVDKWGAKKLAYPINYKTEGYYVLVNFASEAEFVAELERVYNITDGLLRTIVIRK